MDTVRLNITLPGNLVRQLDRIVGPRKKSRFIAQILRRSLESIRKREIEKLLEEGYRSRREESRDLSRQFETIDIEGWDDY